MVSDLVKRIKDEFDIPLILKGIATAEDEGLACEDGGDVVYVSKHGDGVEVEPFQTVPVRLWL